MIEKSISQQLKIIFVYLFFGFGIGTIISIVLILGFKALPDTMGYSMLVIVSITLLYSIFRLSRDFNKVIIDTINVTVVSFWRQKTIYPYSSTKFEFVIGGYKVYGAKFAPVLHLITINTLSEKTKKYRLPQYDDEKILEIINSIEKNTSKNQVQ